MEKVLRAVMDLAVARIAAAGIAADPAIAEENLKGTDAKVVMAAVNVADRAVVAGSLNDMAVKVVTAVVNIGVEDLLPAVDGNPVAKTTGAKAGKTSATTIAARAGMAATVVSPVENAVTVKVPVDMVRDREVIPSVITIRVATGQANHMANRDAGMITTGVTRAERNVAGGTARRMQ